MKLLLIFLVFFAIIVSCQSPTTVSTTNKVVDTSSYEKDIIKKCDYTNLPVYSLPMGSDVVLKQFPKHFRSYNNTISEENTLNTLSSIAENKLYTYIDSLLSTSYSNKDSSCILSLPFNEQFTYYADYMNDVYTNKENYSNLFVLGKVKLPNQNPLLTIGAINSQQDTYQHLISIDSTGNYIDGLNIAYQGNIFEFSASLKAFYIDNNGVIHLQSFISIDDTTTINEKTSYILSKLGYFLRYFSKPAFFFKSTKERGTVKNHLQEGKWITLRYSYATEEYIYLISHYNEGYPTGEWNYYSVEENSKLGEKLPITAKLVYTEIYQDGKLINERFPAE